MNIVLITPIYALVDRPDLILDTSALHYFTRQWVKNGHKVNVFHMYFHEFKEIWKYKPYFGFRIQKHHLEGVDIYLMENRCLWKMKTVRKLQLMVAAKRFNQILKKLETPDVFLVHLPCKLAGFTEKINFKGPRIAVLHNSDLLKLKKKKVHVSYIEQNFIALGFRSLSIQRRFEEISRHKKKTFLVYSGAPDLGDVAQIKRKNKNGVHFLYVGKLIPLKKVDMILNALARFGQKHQFHFTIIGDGEQMPYLKKLAETLSLEKRITFCGELDRKIVFSKMAETDVFVMVSSPETFGLVYIEAMSFGCITIGTKNEGIDGVIRNGENGFLVPAGDEKMLLKCFERIVELNDQDYERISRNAMLTAANMTEEKVAENYLTNVSAICSFSSGSRK